MSWRENLQQAAFRGAKFHVRSHQYEVGRRNVVHQYPFKDKPYVEDLGLDADGFTIEGYVIASTDNGYDYFSARNALISALREEGPGTLVHPYLGERWVSLVGRASIREEFSEGGIAYFTMTFTDAGLAEHPKEIINAVGSVDLHAENLANTSLDTFNDQFDMTDAPFFSRTSMLADMQQFISAAKNKINSIRRAPEAALYSVKSVLDDSLSTMQSALRLPCVIGNAVLDTVDSVLGIANVISTGYLGQIVGQCSGQVIKRTLSLTGDNIPDELGESMTKSMLGVVGHSSITGYGSPVDESITAQGGLVPISVKSLTTAKMASNRLAFVNLVKGMYLAGAVRSAIRTEYKNQQEMEIVQEVLIESIDYFLAKIGDESASDPYKQYGIYIDNSELYNKTEELRSVFSKGMKEKYFKLPYERTIEVPPDGTTSLHVAYERYEDLNRDEEVFLRNQPVIQHPGFMTEYIKILSQ